MTWLLYAAGAAIFAALTTVLAKIGIKNVDSHLATAIRTGVVLLFAWLMVFIVGAYGGIRYITGTTWVFLMLSGLATGGSWLCFFRALQLGDVNKVVPIDKSSTILTMILAFIFLRESVGLVTVAGMVLMAVGTWLMLEFKKAALPLFFRQAAAKLRSNFLAYKKKRRDTAAVDEVSELESTPPAKKNWLFFALLAALLASLVAIFGRIGVQDMDANLWTAMRTMVVVPLSWLMVFMSGSYKEIKNVSRKSWIFLILSGVATGFSWLLFYHALQIGNASHVVPIDKLSIVLTMGFARIFLGERFSWQSLIGLALLTVGTLLPIFI